MTRRSRIIAVQAVIVVALALVVVLTLLRPQGDDPLFDVSTPNPDARGPVIERDHDGGLALTGPPLRTRGRTAGARAPAGGAEFGGSVAASPATTLAPKAAPPSDRGRDQKPTADQYDDTLARLTANLD